MPAEAAIGAVVTQAAAGVAEAVGSAAPAAASAVETAAAASSTVAQAGAVGATEVVGTVASVAEAAAGTATQSTTQGAEAVVQRATQLAENVVRVTGTRGPDAGLRALGGQGDDTWGTSEPINPPGGPNPSTDGSATATENPPVDSASAPEPNRVAEPPETDEDAPVGERLTTAKSRRTEAKMALREGRKNGLSQQELLKLQEEYEDAESLYRDTQAESDRSYADQRVASIQEKLDVALRSNAALEARLSQTEQRMAEAIEALIKLINAKTEEERKSLLELLAQIVVYMTAGIVGDMVTDVKDAATEPPPQRR